MSSTSKSNFSNRTGVTIPKALAPWTAELSLIHPDCWSLLGQLLPKLEGALFRPAAGADNEWQQPDGFDGVTQRGLLSRLLPTEWGLLNFESDEFYRRHLMGESQYLKLAKRKQQQPKAFHVLLDRGPDQYGAPILIQLACLLVLYRRAREHNIELHVGFLQSPSAWIVATPDTLEHRIHAYISHARVLPNMLEAWQEALRPKRLESSVDVSFPELSSPDISSPDISSPDISSPDISSLWVVASARQSIPFGQQLVIASEAQTTDDSLDTFSALFVPRNQTLHFQLPGTRAALRLLRRPFKLPSVLASSDETDIDLKTFQLHPMSRVCFFYTDKKLLTVKIPNRIRPDSKRLKSYQQTVKHRLLGVWYSHNQTAIVQADEHMLYCSGFFKQARIEISLAELPEELTRPRLMEVAPLAYSMRDDRRAVIVIEDGEHNGFMLRFGKQSNQTVFAFEEAIALGKLKYKYLVQQRFYYSDGSDRAGEVSLLADHPTTIQHPGRVQGFVQKYGRYPGRGYVMAMPLLINPSGHWSAELRGQYAIEIGDKPLNANSRELVVQRGEFEIWQFIRDYKSKQPTEPRLVVRETEPIVKAVYQLQNQWVAYQTEHWFKIYDLKNDSAMMSMSLISMELSHQEIRQKMGEEAVDNAV